LCASWITSCLLVEFGIHAIVSKEPIVVLEIQLWMRERVLINCLTRFPVNYH
jgi:hypothetical protein